MKRLIGIVFGIGILALFAWTLFFLWSKDQAKAVVYKTEKPVRTDILKKTVATGSIVPRQEVEIKPRVSGIVEVLHVEPGQFVKEGDLIAVIKIVPDMVTLSRAEANLNQARISFNNAKRELERHRDLFRQKVISETELSKFELDYELRQEELAAAEDNLALVKRGASKGKASNKVMSTVEGMVLAVPVKVGASVIESNTFNAGTTIASVADMNDMIFQGKVDESEVGKIKEGMPLRIKIGALEETVFEGTLEHIAPKGEVVDGVIQFEIKAAIAVKEGVFIRANYSANADVVLDRRDQVLAIPETLLQFDDGKPFVEVEVGPQQFERRDIEVGLSDGINIEVVSGLDENAVIKKPDQMAKPGPRRGR